jgi:hypothetical protein
VAVGAAGGAVRVGDGLGDGLAVKEGKTGEAIEIAVGVAAGPQPIRLLAASSRQKVTEIHW